MPVLSGFMRWLLCGVAGGGAIALLVLVFDGLGTRASLVYFPLPGFVAGLLAGAVAWLLSLLVARGRESRAWSRYLVALVLITGAFVAGEWMLAYLSWALRSAAPHFSMALDSLGGNTCSIYLARVGVYGITAAAGAAMGAWLWWWPERSRGTARRQGALLAAAVVVVWWLGWMPVSPLWASWCQEARAASCRSSLKSLCLGLLMYAQDYDGHLPLCAHGNDLPGVDYERLAQQLTEPCPSSKAVLGGGAIMPYVKNAGIFHCPSDPWNLDWRGRPIADRFPEPGVSYSWHAELAGEFVEDLPPGTWMLRDREAWHRGGRNMGYADGHAEWVRE